MKDRVPTQVVNGAVRMAQYNASGALMGYIYLKRDDEPSEPGTPYNVNSVLTDATAEALGIDAASNPTPNDAFSRIANLLDGVEPKKNLNLLATVNASAEDEMTDITLPKNINQYSKLYLTATDGGGFGVGNSLIGSKTCIVDIYENGAIAILNDTAQMEFVKIEGNIDTNHITYDNVRTSGTASVYGVEAAT